MLNEQELALVTGMTPAQVAGVLDRLAQLGAVELVEERPRPVGPVLPPANSPSEPPEAEEVVDLEPERKRRVYELFQRLDDLTYYELLGVATDADKKQVKSAYYAIAPEFHPDKYFRKNLGTYKQKIETIFARITLAHDVLTVQKRRAEYDAYLDQTHKNRAVSAVLERPEVEVTAVVAAIEQAVVDQVRGRRDEHPTDPVPVSSQRVEPISARLSPDEALRQRREALARKLAGGRRPGPSMPPPKSLPPEMDPAVAERAAEAMRQRQEGALADAKRAQLQRYLDSGRTALERADYAGAANSYRIAASLAPEDPAVEAICNEGLQAAAAALADGYWKQATYEEGQELWSEAALSYSKVCAGRPDDALAHDRVAYATLKSSANVRRAVEFARRAVELAPTKPEFHITLARAYAAAGLEKSSKGELDRALELAPKDPRIMALTQHVRSLSPKPGKLS